MKREMSLGLALAILVTLVGACSPSSGGPVAINVATAGDTNMADLQKDVFGPAFIKNNPNVTINVVGTGPGDPGSAAIYTKLKAQKDAGKKNWDIDVAVVHQSIMESLIKEDMLEKYVPTTSVAKYVVSEDAKNSLGTNVDGYVIPMFHSQVVIAYNPKYVTKPPKTYQDIIDYAKANPKKFGYNGIKGGMSGLGLTTGYLYWKSGQYDLLTKGPYDTKNEAKWADIFKELKAINDVSTITNGNAGTLDMLNRGEIYMGPVWVDMLVLWKNEGRMDPSIEMALPDPGIPGQPMYLVVPKEAAHKAEAIKFIEMIASPEQQASVIVERNGWYPGIDPNVVLPKVSKAAQDKLFRGVSADDINKKGLLFPLAPYFKDLQDICAQATQ
ncbi:MAG: extracellular solute-binding protein [Chloroflexota bacterium]|nr:extracellular solute-binding protein [Chloroflexota bacterium]